MVANAFGGVTGQKKRGSFLEACEITGAQKILPPELVASWETTGMVGTVRSKIAALGPGDQHVLKLACCFRGPFSALDLASAHRRVCRTAHEVINYDMVLLLCSCIYLNKMGYMRRVKPWKYTPSIPRWVVKNLLVRAIGEQMVCALVFFKGQRRREVH